MPISALSNLTPNKQVKSSTWDWLWLMTTLIMHKMHRAKLARFLHPKNVSCRMSVAKHTRYLIMRPTIAKTKTSTSPLLSQNNKKCGNSVIFCFCSATTEPVNYHLRVMSSFVTNRKVAIAMLLWRHAWNQSLATNVSIRLPNGNLLSQAKVSQLAATVYSSIWKLAVIMGSNI